ncbi:hypothetical protein [Proteiniborus sp. MB09-C3]|uniref:hypothetical protein n=1 Tax=Proteiniborus sp. MB09-C3 TaxID=3050072 RepID=UPI002556CE6A|nr:hypothetical protein [Proteiniborus sp. MB09-C3]WIV13736.1 hypothetical protein QO263_08580 [Proteiniborus sp. MB09-C3]
MKDNRGFLEGVYNKAKLLERKKAKRSMVYKRYARLSTVAAAIVIAIPLLLYRGQSSVPKGYTEIHQIQTPRVYSIDDPMLNFYTAEYIIAGETREVGKSQFAKEDNYIYTDITIRVEQVFLGDIHKDEIILRVKGGKVKKEKVFSVMEGEFKKGSKSLLFLQEREGIYYLVNGSESQFLEAEKNIFIDKQGNKYKLDDIKNYINRR